MKPTLIFATPRSGSTRVYEAVKHYLAATAGIGALGEYFDYYQRQVREGRGGIEQRLGAETLPFEESFEQRFFLLMKWSSRYCLKVFPLMPSPKGFVPLPEDKLALLRERFDWVFVERRNLLDQALSLAISWSTGVFLTEKPEKIEEGSLEFHPEVLPTLVRYLREYESAKLATPGPRPTLVYEDFIELSPQEILGQLGLREPVDFSTIRATVRQNPIDKLRLFKDPAAVVRGYRASPLQALFPLA